MSVGVMKDYQVGLFTEVFFFSDLVFIGASTEGMSSFYRRDVLGASTEGMSLEELLGANLTTSAGEKINTSTIAKKNKTCVLYFSAHWCGPLPCS